MPHRSAEAFNVASPTRIFSNSLMRSLPKLMKAVQLTGHGGPEKLVFRADLPVPTPGPREVLIQVHAAAVNNTDLNTRLGWYSKSDHSSSDASWTGTAIPFPLIQGADACGRVVAWGKEVDPALQNARVLVEPCLFEAGGQELDPPWYFGSDCDGAFAEYTVVAARHAHPIRSTLTDVELASFPCSYSTAENLLTRAQVQSGERVLVTGASGGVGSAAVQLARARGAHVIAVASPPKAARLLEVGAEQVLERDAPLIQELGRNAVDVVVDVVGGKRWPDLLEVLKPFGRYATSGAIAGPLVELDLRTLYLKDLTLFGGTMINPEVFPNLIRRLEAGELQPLVDQTFSLQEVPQAQAQFATKQHLGKLVISMPSSGT